MKHAKRKPSFCLLLAGSTLLLLLLAPAHARDRTLKEDSEKPVPQQETAETRSVQTVLAAAQEAMEREEYGVAATLLENLLFQHPGQRDALLNLAYCYSRMDRRADAIDLYRQTLELDPKLLPARLNLSVLLAEEGKFDEAVAELKRALELAPDHYHARLAYALALEQASERDAALEQYLRAAELDPKAIEPRLAALTLLREEKEWPEVAKLLDQLLALEPANQEWMLMFAEVLTVLGKDEEALAVYEKFLQQTACSDGPPSVPAEIHLRAGRLYRRQGKAEKALDHFAAAGRVGGKAYARASAREQARTLVALKRYPEAVPLFRRALALEQGDLDTEDLADFGYALLQAGQFAQAIPVLAQVLQTDPKRVEAHNHLASALFLAENYTGTVQVLEQRARLAEETLGTLFLRALGHDKLGHCAEAMEYYQKFLDLNTDTESNQFFQATGRLRALKKICRQKRRRVK